jgi:outer membrane lipoprotein SlyB
MKEEKGVTEMRVTFRTLIVVALGLALAGCASSLSGDVYSRDEARQVQSVDEGEVIMVREVMIEGTKSGAGAVAGGIMGYAVGSAVGSGSGRTIARAAGTVGGAAAGAGVEEAATRQQGLEITVQLESGEVVAIVQAADREFRVGDEVKVLRRPDGSARVIQ